MFYIKKEKEEKIEEKRGESLALLRPLVRKYVEASLALERGKRWMSVESAISGFFAAPYLAMFTVLEKSRIDKENGEKRGFLELVSNFSRILWLIWDLSWGGLINSKESDEEWREYVDEEVEYTTSYVLQGWLIMLEEAARQSHDTVLMVDEETMLPIFEASSKDFNKMVKEIILTISGGHCGIGWIEFVEILKAAKKQIPEKILPDDIAKRFVKGGITIIASR